MRALTLLKKEEEFTKIQERFISLTDEKTFTKEIVYRLKKTLKDDDK